MNFLEPGLSTNLSFFEIIVVKNNSKGYKIITI